MKMQPLQVEVWGGHGLANGLRGVARFDGEAELAVEDAGGSLFVSVGIDAGGHPQQHFLGNARGGGHFFQQGKLVETVDDNAAYLPLHGLLQLFRGLVAAVEVDQFLGEVHHLGHRQFAAGNHVQPQTLRREDLGDGGVDVGLAGVGHGGVGMTLGELLDEAPAATSKGSFVEDVERGAELRGQVYGVAAADDQMPCVVHFGSTGKDVPGKHGQSS